MRVERPSFFEPRSVPAAAYDSVLLMGQELPVESGFDLLLKFKETPQFGQTPEFRATSRYFLQHLDQLSPVLSYFQEAEALAAEANDRTTVALVKTARHGFSRSIADHVRKYPEDFDRQNAGQLIQLAVKDKHAKEYRSLVAGLVRAEMAPEVSTDLLYEFCLASLDDDETKTFVLRLLNFDTQFYHQDDPMEKSYLMGLYSANDNHLRQSLEIDTFIELMSPLYLPEAVVKNGNQQRFKQLDRPWNINYMTKMLKDHPLRLKQLSRFYGQTEGDGPESKVTIDPKKAELFPYNLILKNQGPLMRITYEELGRLRPDTGYTVVATPKLGTVFHSIEAANSFSRIQRMVLNHLRDTQPTVATRLSNGELKSVVGYLRDEVSSVADIGEVMRLKRKLTERIQTDFRRPLSQRGNRVDITDPRLQSLGYTRVLFKPDKRIDGLVRVHVYLGNFYLELALNKDFNLVHPDTLQPIDKGETPIDGVGTLLMQTWILGHLEELVCTETDELISQNVKPEQRKAFTEGYIARIGHTRVVKRADFVPNEEQRRLAMEQQRWDMLQINDRRREKGLMPLTYVRQVDEIDETVESKPVTSHAKSATHLYRKILK